MICRASLIPQAILHAIERLILSEKAEKSAWLTRPPKDCLASTVIVKSVADNFSKIVNSEADAVAKIDDHVMRLRNSR